MEEELETKLLVDVARLDPEGETLEGEVDMRNDSKRVTVSASWKRIPSWALVNVPLFCSAERLEIAHFITNCTWMSHSAP